MEPVTQARIRLMVIMLVSLMGTVGIALPYPILSPLFLDGPPTEFTHYLSLPPKFWLGFALAIYPLGMLIGGSFIGALSDNYGRRKTLIWTLVLSALGNLFSAWALTIQDLPLFLFARLVTGICEGNVAIARAYAADLSPQISKSRAMPMVHSSVYLGWLTGPLAGGYLMPYGAEVPFYFATVTVVICILLVGLFLPDSQAKPKTATSMLRQIRQGSSLSLLSEPLLRRAALFHLLIVCGTNTFYEFYPVLLVERFDYDSRQIAQMTVILTLTMIAISSLAIKPIRQSLEDASGILLSATLSGLLMLLLPLTGANMLLPLFAIMGIAIAIYNGIFPILMSEQFGEGREGQVQGLLVTLFCAANVVVALSGSWLALLDTSYTLWLGSLLFIFGGIGLFQWRRGLSPQLQTSEQAGEA